MSPRLRIINAAWLTLLVTACADPSAPLSPRLSRTTVAAVPEPAAGCTFETGTTTCVTLATHEETSTHQEFSGCLYGPTGIPSSRVRTFLDTFQVVEETVTLQHGLEGAVYDSTTYTVSRTLLQRTLISDVCNPPGT